jgi:iron complex transport system ATP-binding protein
MESTAPLLTASQLQLTYGRPEAGGYQALKNVGLQLHPREILAVLGPNGAGKSSLLHVLCGWHRPDSGEVRLGGDRLEELSRLEAACRLAVLAQQESPPADYTVRELVELGRFCHQEKRVRSWVRWFPGVTQAHPEDEAAVEQAIRWSCLEGYEQRVLGRLSGGERQRALLARCLAQTPQILLLDEPVSSLDPSHQQAVLTLVRRLVDEGRVDGAIVVLHDVNQATWLADRVLLLNQGELLGWGTPQEVLTLDRLHQVFGLPYREFLPQPDHRVLYVERPRK